MTAEWTIEVRDNDIQRLNKELKEGKCTLGLTATEKWERVISDWKLDYILFG